MNIKNTWIKALEDIKSSGIITKISYTTFFENLVPISFKDGIFIIEANNDFTQVTINNRYRYIIEDILSKILNTKVELKVNTSDLDFNTKESQKVLPYELPLLNPRYSFEHFIVGNNNRLAHAACVAVAEVPSESYNPLFIYGGVGLGKTHLMHAIGHHILSHKSNYNIMYVTTEQFTNELIQSIQSKTDSPEDFRQKYRNVDVLLIDDIQFIQGKERTQEEFFHTFNALHNSNKQIVITSDRPPEEIPTLENRLVSRFKMGLITDIQCPDYETRVAILQDRAQVENFKMDEDAYEFIAKHVNSNIRELEGALNKVKMFSVMLKSPITIDVCKEALKDMLKYETIDKKSIKYIKKITADMFGTTVTELEGSKRTKNITLPRQVAMFVAREVTDMSLPKIGDAFGGRDHSTVIHAIDKITKDIAKNEDLNIRVHNIIEDIISEEE